MTTLAYKNGYLAADGKATRGDLVVELDARKVRRLRDGSVAGITGNPSPAMPFFDWLNSGAAGMAPSLGSNCCVVHLRKNGSLRVYEDGGWQDEDPKKAHAWGSGWQIAATAMKCGKSAREAVSMASKMDVWSGGRVLAMSLNGITQRQADAAVRKVRARLLTRAAKSAHKA